MAELYLPNGRKLVLPAPPDVREGEISLVRKWRPPVAPVATPGLLRHRARSRTVTLPNGRKALVTVDDSGTVYHRERDDGLDAVVRPKTIRYKVRRIN